MCFEGTALRDCEEIHGVGGYWPLLAFSEVLQAKHVQTKGELNTHREVKRKVLLCLKKKSFPFIVCNLKDNFDPA